MVMPGGSRRENQNGVLGGVSRDAEPSLDGPCEFAGFAGNGEYPPDAKRGDRLVRDGQEGERDTSSGVWLSAEDGTVLFHPATAGTRSPQRWSAPEVGSVEEADEMTLDAASRLMPLLPRELIAEYLQLGRFREGGEASM